MPWAALDDGWWNHPKLLAVSPSARALHAAAISYCNQQLTDGVIRREMLAALLPGGNAIEAAAELTRGDLFEVHPSGHYLHDYLDYSLSRAEIERRREAKRASGEQSVAKRKWRPVKGQPKGRALSVGQTPLPLPTPDLLRSSPSPSESIRSTPVDTMSPSATALRSEAVAEWNRIAVQAHLPSHRLVPKSLARDLDAFLAECRHLNRDAPMEPASAAFAAAALAYAAMSGPARYGLPNLLRRANRAKWLAAYGSSENNNGRARPHLNPRSVQAQLADLPPLPDYREDTHQ